MSDVEFILLKRKFKGFFYSCYQYFPGFVSWHTGMSYLSWQRLSKRTLWFIGRSKKYKKRDRGSLRRHKRFLGAKRRLRDELTAKQTGLIVQELETLSSAKGDDFKIELITMLKKFWETKHISKHIESMIPDRRNKKLITYSKQSIMMSAISIFLFRIGSGNKYDVTGHDEDEKYSRRNISRFIESPEERVPVIKTIEKFLKNLEEKCVNDLMISFFRDLQKSKFFTEHKQIMPGDFFLLAADCVHTHTYTHPHHTDIKGENDCPCCLKRVYNKGTENEKVRWIHSTLVFSFIFIGGLKIPIYRHPIHAKQVVDLEYASEDTHKQECEIIALKSALPIIRESFPRMKIVLLLDGLYANRPVIRLAEEHQCEYIIVRKEACLPLLAKECDERASQPNHKKNCVKKCQGFDTKGWKIIQKYEWFNNIYLGEEITTSVLRFDETRERKGDDNEHYKCEWLFSWRLSSKTCELAARQARLRWQIEDVFNSLKNRGLNFEHDYSRDPRSCFNWQGLALFAFGIFELYRFSESVKQRVDIPQSTLADKLLGQLLHAPTEELFSQGCLKKRVQFRYHFVIEVVLVKEMPHNTSVMALKPD